MDESYSIIEFYTGGTFAPGQRRGLGTEPMTCLPTPSAAATG
ncbi:MAG: hypothetical protein ACRDOD_15600 [Streptosporangiaceae bacterium]